MVPPPPTPAAGDPPADRAATKLQLLKELELKTVVILQKQAGFTCSLAKLGTLLPGRKHFAPSLLRFLKARPRVVDVYLLHNVHHVRLRESEGPSGPLEAAAVSSPPLAGLADGLSKLHISADADAFATRAEEALDDLATLNRWLSKLGLGEEDSKTKARAALQKVHINIYDLVNERCEPVFSTVKELAVYSKKNKKIFSKERAKQDGALKPFLRRLFG